MKDKKTVFGQTVPCNPSNSFGLIEMKDPEKIRRLCNIDASKVDRTEFNEDDLLRIISKFKA